MLIVWVISGQTFVQHPHSQLPALLNLQQDDDIGQEYNWNGNESDNAQSQMSYS